MAVTVDPATAASEATRALAPELRARAREGERLRTMPPELVDRVEAAGLFVNPVERDPRHDGPHQDPWTGAAAEGALQSAGYWHST